jgi:phosphotransacetylase/butyrate kinase
MFDLDKSVDEQLAKLFLAPKSVKPIIVFPEATDPRIIAAASGLLSNARVVLLGSYEEIRALCDYKTVDLCCARDRFFSKVIIINPDESSLVNELASALVEASKGRKWEYDFESAREKVLQPVFFAAMLVRKGYADACLGGVSLSTKDFLAPCLRLIKSAGTAFEMGLFALPEEENPLWEKNIVMFADVALNLQPSPQQLSDIAVESCKTLRDIIPVSVLPEINGALISYSTKGSGQGPSVETIRLAEPLVQAKLQALKAEDSFYESIAITAELQISVAVSKDAAKVKLKDRMDEFKGAGQANVLIVPSLDEGNMLYHLFNTQYPVAKSSLIMGGMHGQVLDYSRGSSIIQIIRGAKLLLLTRLKSSKPLAIRSPLFPSPRILVVNPEADWTQLALYEGEAVIMESRLHYDRDGNGSEALAAQLEKRLTDVGKVLQEKGVGLDVLDLIGVKGGLIEVPGPGAYKVNKEMLAEVSESNESYPAYPGNLGPYMGWLLGGEGKVPVFATDFPTVNEISEVNRVANGTGGNDHPIWNALNQRQVGRMYADSLNLDYIELKLVIAHLGEEISIGAHVNGKCVNVSNIYSGLGNAQTEIDKLSNLKIEALAAKIASEIMAKLVEFYPEKPEQILLTGVLCESERILSLLLQKLKVLDIGITIYPGSFEAEALRDAAIRIYTDMEPLQNYGVTVCL